jgi:hypothetical protein
MAWRCVAATHGACSAEDAACVCACHGAMFLACGCLLTHLHSFALVCTQLSPEEQIRLVLTMVQRLVSLGQTACLNTAQLCQIYQFFVWCTLEPRLGVEAINDMQSLKETCRAAFEGTQTNPSAAQQRVSKTLRDMGLSVEVETRCPKSGYSIDILVPVHDSAQTGGERSSGRTWALEFDGPSHFLASGAPTGATLLKRRHLEVLGHALVIVPFWEWSGCKGAGERDITCGASWKLPACPAGN